MRAVLRNRGFRCLLGAQMALALGDAFMRMGLLEVFRRCALDLEVETAKMFFALTLPGLVFGPFAMIHLDRWRRKHVLVVSDVLRGGLMVLMVLWLWRALAGSTPPASLLPVHLLIFLIGTLVTFYLPARYAVLPDLVETGQLIPANTLITVSMAVLAVGGMPLGGYAAVRWGALPAIALNAVAYAVAALFLVRLNPRRSTSPRTANDRQSWDQLRAGLAYLWQHPTIVPLVLIATVFAFMAGILIVTIVGYAEKTLGLDTLGLGWLGGAAGVGAGLGVALIGGGRPWTRSIWLPPAQLIFGGALLGLLSYLRQPWAAAPLLMMLGAVGATAMIPIDAKLQEEVDDDRRGAVFAARGMFTSGTMLVAFWLKFGTEVLRTTPPPVVLQCCSAGAMLVALLTFVVLRKRHRQNTPGT